MSEALALRWSDVDFATGMLNVPGTKTAAGKQRHAVGNAVRPAGDRATLNPDGVRPVAPHDLRHSCAGLLFAAGAPVPKVAAILRHASPRITLTVYAGLVESQRAELRDDPEAALL